MKKLIWTFWGLRVSMIIILSCVALGGLIAASPTLISDWIFRTGQHTFTVYNSSTQAIESVDNRNRGRKQYGALSVDGTLYANGAISATGAINIGADVSLSRSAADVLATPDSITSATHTITGTLSLSGSVSNVALGTNYINRTGIDGKGLLFNSNNIPYFLDYLGIGATDPVGYGAHLAIYAASPQLSVIDQSAAAFINLEQKSNVASLVRDNGDILTIGTKVNVLTEAVTPQLTIDTAGNVGIGTISPSEKLYVSGNIYSTANISGLSFTDRTPGSPEDALKEIGMWKVMGDQVDHESLGAAMIIQAVTRTGFEIKDKAGNVFNSIEEKVTPVKGSKDAEISALSEAVTKLEDGIAEVSAEYTVKEVTRIVYEKGRDLSKTVSILSRAIQQLSERLDKLEGR